MSQFSRYISVCVALLSSSFAVADDWPVFRGPDRNGISKETGWNPKPDEATIAWTAQVGMGFSCAIVSRKRVYITGHDGENSDRIFCFEEDTGKELWVYRYPQPLGSRDFQGGTTASVTIDEDRLYHVAREGEVFCLNALDGSEIWKTHLQTDHEYSKPTWGFSGAPISHGARLYINAGESGLALNKMNGDVIWKSEDEEAGYTSPYLFTFGGRELIIFTNKRYYNCVEADSGKKLWEVKWMTRMGVNAADPIVTGNNIFISTGYDKGAIVFHWDGKSEPNQLWKNREMKSQMNAVIHIDGKLYGIDGNQKVHGTGLKCLDLVSGETVWSDPSTGFGAITVVDDKLIVITEEGELQIAPVSPVEYSPVFKQKVIDAPVWTAPVLANGRVYCRNGTGDLVVVDLNKGPRKK